MKQFNFFTSERQVAALAAAFYKQSIPLSKWNKAAQLSVTLYYACRFPRRMACELLCERMKAMSCGNYPSADLVAELEPAIQKWLQTAKEFALKYRNIDDLASMANIFIATYWDHESPYPQLFDPVLADADTARLADRENLHPSASLVPLPA